MKTHGFAALGSRCRWAQKMLEVCPAFPALLPGNTFPMGLSTLLPQKSSKGWLETWPTGPDTSRRGAGGKRCLHPVFHPAPVELIPLELRDAATARSGSMAKHGNMAELDDITWEILSTGDTRTSITLTASGRTESYKFGIYQRKQGHK